MLALDDVEEVLRLVARVLTRAGVAVETFTNPRDFLARASFEPPCCVLLDVQMPEMGGLDVQDALTRLEVPPPVVFLSGAGDVPTSVRAMKAGAVDFLAKPFAPADLLAAVAGALARSLEASRAHASRLEARSRLARLTPREREVAALVAQGLQSKEISQRLGAAVKTVNVHRARIMAKLEVRSVVELAKLVAQAATG